MPTNLLPTGLQTEVDKLRRMRFTDNEKFESVYKEAAQSFKDSMRNLALAVGSLVAASLVLMSSDVPSNRFLVIAGVIILTINELVIFYLILKSDNDRIYKILKQWEDERAPVGKILNAHQDFLEGTKTAAEFTNEWNVWSESQNNNVRKTNEHSDQKLLKKNYTYAICVAVFALGSFFIIAGMLTPYIWSSSSTTSNIAPTLPDTGYQPH